MKNEGPGDFSESIYRVLVVQTEVCVCPFIDEDQTEALQLQTD